MVDPLRVDALLYGSLGLSDDLSELGILRELVSVGLPRRAPTVPIEERLSLPVAPRTAGRDAHHRARCASKRASGACGLCGTVAEITGVPERRDKRTRLVHDAGGWTRGYFKSPESAKKRQKRDETEEGDKVGRLFCWLVLTAANKETEEKKEKSDDCQLPGRGGIH